MRKIIFNRVLFKHRFVLRNAQLDDFIIVWNIDDYIIQALYDINIHAYMSPPIHTCVDVCVRERVLFLEPRWIKPHAHKSSSRENVAAENKDTHKMHKATPCPTQYHFTLSYFWQVGGAQSEVTTKYVECIDQQCSHLLPWPGIIYTA